MGKLINIERYRMKKAYVSKVDTNYKLMLEHLGQYSMLKSKRFCPFRGIRLKFLSYKVQRDKNLIASYTRLYCNID